MNAVEALKQAQSSGIRVGIDGDDLVLEASAPPPAEVLDLLKRHKPDIVTLLRPSSAGWSGMDWREFFDERSGIAEFGGGLMRDQAEAEAFFCCVGEWLRRNPVRSPPGRCEQCGKADGLLIPYVSGYSVKDPGQTWLHHECAEAWHRARRDSAIMALRAMGIPIGSCLSNAEKESHRSNFT